MSYVYTPRLSEGRYPVQLLSYEWKIDDKGTVLICQFKFEDKIRTQWIFENRFDYFFPRLIKQLGWNPLQQYDSNQILDAVKKMKELNVWVSYSNERFNINFDEPRKATK